MNNDAAHVGSSSGEPVFRNPLSTAVSSMTPAAPKDPSKDPIAAQRAENEQLRRELNIVRKPVSECVKDLMAYCEGKKNEDFLIPGQSNGAANPFVEKRKCDML